MATAAPPERKQGWLDWMGLGAGTFAARTWVFGNEFTATLEHDCMIGRRILTVNGKELYNETVFPDRGFDLEFRIGTSTGCASVKNVHSELAIYYTLKWEGKEVVSTVFRKNKSNNSSLEANFNVSVPIIATVADITIYKVLVKNLKAGTTKTLDKRFSDFVELHHKVWSSYAGSHLLSNVPTPPERKWKLFTDHNNPAFLENRRVGLHAFISKLVQIPRISSNVYVLDFLGERPVPKSSEIPYLLSICKVPVELPSGSVGAPSTTNASAVDGAPALPPADKGEESDAQATPTGTEAEKAAPKQDNADVEEEGESDWI